jgi:hypothetical protein
MRNPRLAQALAAVGFAALGASANADPVPATYIGMTPQDVGVMDRARPEYDAKGIPLGGFRLFADLEGVASYDDNVFRLPKGDSDYFFTITPSLRLESQWGRHFFEIYAGANTYQFVKFTEENLTDWKAGSDARFDISRAAVMTANVYYGEFHETWESPNVVGFQAAPNRYYRTHAELTGAVQPNRLGFGFGGSFDRYQWQKTPAIGGGFLFNSDRDEDEYQAYGKVFYDFSPGYSAFVKATYDSRSFDHMFDRSGLDRSSHGYRVDGGVDMQISHLLRGELFAGYIEQRFPQNVPTPLPNVSGFDFGAQLDWFASPLLTLHLTASRTLNDVILSGASVADNRSIGISADYEFRRNIILQGRFSYTDAEYVGTSRTDQYPSAGVSLKYLINRYLSADLGYNYSERSTDVSGLDYTDDTVSLGLHLHV